MFAWTLVPQRQCGYHGRFSQKQFWQDQGTTVLERNMIEQVATEEALGSSSGCVIKPSPHTLCGRCGVGKLTVTCSKQILKCSQQRKSFSAFGNHSFDGDV